jgi:hypothetical protein
MQGVRHRDRTQDQECDKSGVLEDAVMNRVRCSPVKHAAPNEAGSRNLVLQRRSLGRMISAVSYWRRGTAADFAQSH